MMEPFSAPFMLVFYLLLMTAVGALWVLGDCPGNLKTDAIRMLVWYVVPLAVLIDIALYLTVILALSFNWMLVKYMGAPKATAWQDHPFNPLTGTLWTRYLNPRDDNGHDESVEKRS